MFQSPNLNRREATYRAYVQANPTSFSTAPIDDFRQDAIVASTPARLTLTTDATAWGTQPTQDSWQVHTVAQNSPARSNPTAYQGSIASGNTP